MRKSSSHSSRDTRPGGKSTFKKDDGRKPFNKDSKPFKKNYDGRGPSSGASGDGPSRSARPYSGRVADSNSFSRPGSDRKPPFGKDNRPGKGDDDRKPFNDRPKRSFDKDDRKPFSDGPKRSFDKDSRNEGADRKPFNDRPKRSFDKDDRKPFNDRPKRSFDKDDRSKEGEDSKPRRAFDKPGRPGGDRPFNDRSKRSFDKEDRNKDSADRKPRKEFDKPRKGGSDTRPFRDRPVKVPDEISFSKDIDDPKPGEENINTTEKPFKPKKLSVPKREEEDWKPTTNSGKKKRHHHDHDDDEEEEEDKEINQKDGPRLEMPLNKYIAHSGECSRRDAAELVKQGKVKVNGELVLDPGHRVKHDDKVTLSGKKLTPQKGMVYILLNKPKGFITTNDDPQGRKTVMQLVGNSGVDRLFPVGRLDKDTSGLLLITNDGDLTQKLCHPAYNIKKVYHVTLDKPLTKADFEKIAEGVELEDGKAVVDEIAFLEAKNEIGLEIHSGRNRIVRRIFESLGYVVDKLDRVMYAGLTKKNLPRSKWRYLDEREVVLLKHFKS